MISRAKPSVAPRRGGEGAEAVRTRREHSADRAGFSLFEVLLALAILVVLSGAILTFLRTLAGDRERAATAAERARTATQVIERLEADLFTALAGGPRMGAGIRGDSASIRLMSRGVTPPLASAGEIVPLSDLQGSEFRFDAESGELRARRWDALSKDEPPPMSVIGEGIARVRFRYLVGNDWQGGFDSMTHGGLPAAIEVAIWFEDRRTPEPEEDPLAGLQPSGRGVAPVLEAEPVPIPTEAEPTAPSGTPDRVRIIVVPDGPEFDASPTVGGGGSS